MGVWRYCEHCGNGQDQITLEEIEEISYSEEAKVECAHCGRDRSDDTPANRLNLLLKAFIALREQVNGSSP